MHGNLDKKTRIFNFLQTQPLATISTIAKNTNQPESALIAFTQTKELEIIFESFIDRRKERNVQSNPYVALVMGWDPHHHITVQYEGRAALVPDTTIEKYVKLLLAKDTPCTEEFLRDSRARLYKVTPTWIRYSDYTKDQSEIIELDFSV